MTNLQTIDPLDSRTHNVSIKHYAADYHSACPFQTGPILDTIPPLIKNAF